MSENSPSFKPTSSDEQSSRLEAYAQAALESNLVAGGGRLLRHNLGRSLGDGACFGAMVGIGETFLPAFALAVGLGETSAGLIASLPVAVGGVMQLASLQMMRWVGTQQRWVVLCATVQALSFLPLIAFAWSGDISFAVLLMIAAAYWAAGLASGPAWNTWMESIVPPGVRAKYFATRTRFQQVMTFTGMVAGGILLQVAQDEDRRLIGFVALFCAASGFRLASVFFLATHRPDGRWQSPRRTQAVKASEHDDRAGARLLLYLVVVQGAVQISGPFFAPYMLTELQFGYITYVYLLAVAFLFRIGALASWSLVAKRFGAATLMWIGAWTLIPIASLWIVSQNVVWLTLVQALSGVAWAAYELGFFLLFFETLPHARRTKMLTFYNLGNSLAMLAGSAVGALLLNFLDYGPNAYYALFGISTVGRLAAILLLWRVKLKPVPIHYVAIRVLGIRPATAALDVPVLPSMDEGEETAEHVAQSLCDS